MIDSKVTVLVRGASGLTSIRVHVTGAAPPAHRWYWGTDWGARGVLAENDLGVRWIHGWPDAASDEVKALMVAATLADSAPFRYGEPLRAPVPL